MKKFLNFLGEKINEYEEDWDDLEDSDFEEDSENYSDEYTDEEYYTDEEGVEGEYYEEEYVGEDTAAGGYYAGEYVDEQGEYYSEEYVENEDYYPEESDEAYYADDEGTDEYYADEEADDSYYENEEYYEDEYYEEDEELVGAGFLEKVKYMFTHMDMTDRIVACTGIAVLILALVTGTVFAGNRLVAKQVNSFDTVGNQLEGITVIGGEGLVAVADAQIARQEAADALLEGEEGYDEEEYSNEVTVVLNMTSIKKDLKIKFVNKKTGKLIANIPFVVDVTDPKGKKTTWTDDDKDGIIYKTEIAHGEYSVAMQSLEGYDDFKISTASRPVNVKEKLDYEKVDVSDEIKTEAEIDASKEDTAKNDVEQESSLQDTVTWVESSKTPNGETYVEVSKATIDEPKVARFDNFMKLSSVSGGNGGEVTNPETPTDPVTPPAETVTVTILPTTLNLTVGGSASLEATASDGSAISWSTSDGNIASVNGGTVTAVGAGTATITAKAGDASATCTVTVSAAQASEVSLALDKTSGSATVGGTISLALTITGDAGTVEWKSSDTSVATVAGSNSGATVTALKAGTTTITASGGGKSVTCTVTVTEAASELSIKLDKTSGTVAVKGTLDIVPTITGGTSTGTVTWSSDKTDIATVTGDATKATVTGVKAGDATITATYKDGDKTATATCTVKVTDTAVTIKLDKTSGTILAGNTLELIPTITGNATATTKIVWSTSSEAVAKVTGDNTKAVVTGVAKGDVTIKATYTEGSTTVTAECVVKVQANPALDTTTALKDKNGNQMYVLNANGQYVAATYADYFKANQKFYLKQQAYKYTGWQTIDGGVYYYDINGNKVTGDQVIQGAQYSFDSNGKMVSSNGILGIDVSKWNGSIDWKAVKNSGVSYVIIRCGYRGSTAGSLVEDPKYRTNIQGATAAGLKVGVYFFTQAINEIEAVEEASMVLSLVKGYKLSYPIFLDVESSGGRADGISKSVRTEVCKAFCQTIKNSGYTAGVYANKTWFNSYIDAGQLGAYRIWLAQYAAQPTYSGRYDIWQYSSKGKVGGIKGDVDMNLSYMGY